MVLRITHRSLLSTVLAGVLLAGIGWIVYYFIGIVFTRYPDFDGGLNLNVSKSLLDGHGYHNFYDEWVPFFPETNAPFVFPAALSIALFGVSPIGTQLVNLLYLVALLASVYALVARLSSRLTAVVAVFVVLQTPGLQANGMNGYGEVAALTFLFAACFVLLSAIESDSNRLVFFGGAMLALSYLTKTVSLIWIPGTILCFLASRPRARRRSDSLLLILALLLPVLAWELYRLVTLNGLSPYFDWWSAKVGDILDRAGPNTRLRDTLGLWNKTQAHLALLETWLGFPARWFTLAYLVSLALAGLAALRRWRDDLGGRFAFSALFLTAAIYFAWWILLTPTQEAWLRRIMNGLIVAEVIAIVAIYRLAGSRNPVAKIALIALVTASLYTVAHNQLLWDRPDDRVENAANQAFFDRVAALPNDARLYAAAWYQSPVTALIAGRRFYDFTRHSAAEINGSSTQQFLVIEQVALYQRGWLAEVLNRCGCEPVFANAGGRIYRINGAEDDANLAAKRTTFITTLSDGFGAGFYVGDADVRWTSERAQFRLPVSDFDHLVLWLHVPRPEQMTSGPGPSILEIRWGECLLAREQLSAGENHLLIQNPCQDRTLGDTLEFRINGHLTSAAAGRDTRNLSWMFRSMEFMSDAEPTSTSRAGEATKP